MRNIAASRHSTLPPNGWRFTCRAPRRGDGEAADLDADGTMTVRRSGGRSGATACWTARLVGCSSGSLVGRRDRYEA
jgi:hypothetical protein